MTSSAAISPTLFFCVRHGREWLEVDRRIYGAPCANRGACKRRKGTRRYNAVWRHVDYHLDGYYADDVADEASATASSRNEAS